MDTRLQHALEHSNYKASIAIQKENLKLRLANRLIHALNGGTFTVSQQLICFIDTLVRQGNTDAVVIDDKGNPIRIENLQAFLDDIIILYHESVNEYHFEYEKLRRARTIKAMVGV